MSGRRFPKVREWPLCNLTLRPNIRCAELTLEGVRKYVWLGRGFRRRTVVCCVPDSDPSDLEPVGLTAKALWMVTLLWPVGLAPKLSMLTRPPLDAP